MIAVGPSAGDTLEDLWQAADGAMYDAKRSGGNAVSATAPPLAGGALVEP